MKKSISFTILKRTILSNWVYLMSLLIFSILVAIISAVNPIVFQKIIDEAIPSKNSNAVILYVALITCLPIINTILTNFKNKIGYKFSDICSKELRKQCFEKCLFMQLSSFDKIGSQKLMSTITRSVGRITELYIYGDLVNFVTNIVQFFVIIFILNSFDKKISLISCFAIPFLLIIIKLFSEKTAKNEKKYLEHLSKGEKFLLQCFYGIKTIRAFNGQKNEEDSFDNWLETNTKLGWKIKSSHNLVRTILPNAISQFILGILFIVCSFLIMQSKMTVGILVAIISYVPLLISSINGLLSIQAGKAAISKVLKDIDEIVESPQEIILNTPILPTLNEPVFQFENVEFSYERGDFSLVVNDLTINKGDFLIIVGGSGGGKTSIIDILNKFYDIKSGKALFYGEDFSKLSPTNIRENIATVLQDTYIFNKSIKENIIYPQNSANDITEVLEKSQLTDFINSLPEKEATIIDDFGENFSGGECQRICLARALFKNSEILLFDEPTAALDAITSKKIFDMLKNENLNNNKTIIIITHDIGKISYATKVAVVNNGDIVEYGVPKDLLNNDGYLKQLYNSQQNNKKD